MRISDWGSDVCSSDLTGPSTATEGEARSGNWPGWCSGGFAATPALPVPGVGAQEAAEDAAGQPGCAAPWSRLRSATTSAFPAGGQRDRKSVGQGKGLSVRVDIGGGRNIKKKHI